MSETLRVITGLKGIMANANNQAIVAQEEVGTKNGTLAADKATMLSCQVMATAAILQAEMLVEIHAELVKLNARTGKKAKK